MNLKKLILLNAILTFALCFLTHFLYEWLPNPVFSIFFPVNESIWEHMKMLFTTILLYGIVEYFLMQKWHINNNNFLLALFLKALFSIPIYLAVFLPVFYNFGEHMIVTFIILFLVILLVNYLGSLILKLKPINYQKEVSIVFIIVVYIIMGILTYKTPRQDLFFDPKEEKYGINDYLIKK